MVKGTPDTTVEEQKSDSEDDDFDLVPIITKHRALKKVASSEEKAVVNPFATGEVLASPNDSLLDTPTPSLPDPPRKKKALGHTEAPSTTAGTTTTTSNESIDLTTTEDSVDITISSLIPEPTLTKKSEKQ